MATIEELRRSNSFGDASAASRDSRVAQIPTAGYPKAPAADGSQSNLLNSSVGRNVTNTLAALPGVGAVPGAVAMGTGLAARALGASAPAVGAVGQVAQSAAPYAPVAAGAAALHSAAPASTPTPSPAPAAPQVAAPPRTMAQAAFVQPMDEADAPAAPPATGAVTRVGNSYSGGNVSGDVSINGNPPRTGGQISPQNLAAAANLGQRQQQESMGRTMAQAALEGAPGVAAPVVRNSTNDWAARNNLRNLEVSASSITNNGGKFDRSGPGDSAAMAGYKAALSTDQALQQAEPNLAQAAMRENGDLQRETLRQRGADTRSLGQLALEQQKLNQAGEAQAITNRGKTMVQALQEQIATEKDAARRGGLAQRLRELQGQAAPAEWGVQVTPATKNVDGSTTQGSIVRYNKATGQTEVVPQGGQSGAQFQTGQVYVDGQGRRAKLNGTGWEPA